MEAPELAFEHPDKRENHHISILPEFWTRLNEIGVRHYEGSASRAIEGLTLHEWMVELRRLSEGKGLNTHWISAPLVLRLGELAPVLRRLMQGDVDYVGAYFDARIEEATGAETLALRARVLELEAEVAELRCAKS